MKYIVLFLFALPFVAKAAERIECPYTLEVEEVGKQPTGWTVFRNPVPHTLDRIGFYSGSPNDGASLIPRNSNKSRDDWRFVPAKNEATWLACFYNNTNTFLAKQLDSRINKCSVRYTSTGGGSHAAVSSISCE